MSIKPTLNGKLIEISAHESMLNVSKELRPHLIIVTTPELRFWVWTSLANIRSSFVKYSEIEIDLRTERVMLNCEE